MTKTVEGVLTIVEGLSTRERTEFVIALASSGVLTKDQQDILTIESRRKDRTQPLDRFIRKMKQQGRLR